MSQPNPAPTSTVATATTTNDMSISTESAKSINKFDEYVAYEKNQYLLNKKYKFISQVQEGSFGKVTLAVNIKNNTQVAMKAMYKSNAEHIAKHEIKILAQLGNSNENICQLLDFFETSDFVILILEYCSNGDLYDLIHSTVNLSTVDIWDIAREMYNGLKYAHSKGIYHRDIKPENVLFNSVGRVKLCDWGLATTKRYNEEFNVGTEKYMAPECFINKPNFDEYDSMYADYWSFGVTLITAVFGTSPFKPIGESKSLESDSNFKNFVYLNNSQILYDIYPTMNENCFKIFMNLLKIGSFESDLNNFNKIIQSRDLDQFIEDLQNNWKFGLTIDEEYELEDGYNEKDDLFDMDHDDLEYVESSAPTYESESESDNYDECLSNYNSSKKIPIKTSSVYANAPTTTDSMKLPSLVESPYESTTSKSWCDFDDEYDDVEFDRILNQLSIVRNKPRANLIAGDNSSKQKDGDIRFIEQELVLDNNGQVINWYDY